MVDVCNEGVSLLVDHGYLALDDEIDVFSFILLHEEEVITDKRDFLEWTGKLGHKINSKVLNEVDLGQYLSFKIHLELVIQILIEHGVHIILIDLDFLLGLKDIV